VDHGPIEWVEVHRRLREYARHRASLDAAEAFDLLRAEQLKLHFLCGFATMYEYLERVLGYGPHAARERMRVARTLAGLPQITAALARGALTYSAVRELTRVATAETEARWLAAAEGKAVNQIERLVAGHQPGDQPEDPTHPDLRPRVVRIELPPEVYALWRQARSVIAAERGAEISDADFVESLCRGAIAPGTGSAGPSHQIAYQQCPDCRRATQNGAGREIDITPEVFERASCDAKVLGSLDVTAPERATTTVTPRLREQVFARDQHRCTVPGCRSARNLRHPPHRAASPGRDASYVEYDLAMFGSSRRTSRWPAGDARPGPVRDPGSLGVRPAAAGRTRPRGTAGADPGAHRQDLRADVVEHRSVGGGSRAHASHAGPGGSYLTTRDDRERHGTRSAGLIAEYLKVYETYSKAALQ
jgi:hypothetical protein